MNVTGDLLRKSTPVFRVPAPKEHGVSRAWGGVYADGAWQFPAYFPFGRWTFEDIRKLAPGATWEESALQHLLPLRQAELDWQAALASYQAKAEVNLPVDPDFFTPGFTPYSHQRLGISRIVNWWRTFLLWEPGTGKTRTAIDAFRLLRRRGQFRQALILAPPVVLAAWQNETERCSQGSWRVVVWDGSLEAEALAQDADIVLASYTRLRLEREKAHKATLELELTPMQRERYKLPVLSDSDIATLRHTASHPLYQLNYDTIVADESHYLGNFESEQTKSALELSAKASRRICLTGTAGDDPRKLFSQLMFLSPSLLSCSYPKFLERHLVMSPKNKHVVVGFRHLNEVNARVDQVAHRMKKKDCLDLPPCVIVDVPFELGPMQRARYNELVLEMRTSTEPMMAYLRPGDLDPEALPESVSQRLPHGAARVNKMLQLLSGFLNLGADYSVCDTCEHMVKCVEDRIRPYTKKCPIFPTAPPTKILRDVENPKLEAFGDIVETILPADPTNKLIVWANFTSELDDLEKYAKANNIGYVRVDGSNSSRSGPLIEKFQTDPSCRLYLGQIKTGIGITLTAANYLLFYSLPWDPLQYQQAMDRFNRPGQTRAMTVYRLLTSTKTPGLDLRVASVLSFKQRVSLTLVEVIACAGCDQQGPCNEKGILPFREKCKYAANVARPVAAVEVIE